MAFSDNPNIDSASINSEESTNAVRSLFTLRNGFILRTENPDYGVDFNIEVAENKSPTGKMFAVQLKSKEEIQIVTLNGADYCSLPFKTSRLGYLCRRVPMYGLIALYDNLTQKIYYDFVEDIVGRLNDERGNKEWHQNENVSIHLPVTNILNSGTVAQVYRKMLNRAKQTDALIAAYGYRFDIPTTQTSTNKENINFLSADQIKQFGFGFAYGFDFTTLYDSLSRLPLSDILLSPTLIHLIALVYAERGNVIDADYYIKKGILRRSDYTSEEYASLLFLKIKVDVVLGSINEDECMQRLLDLLPLVSDHQNVLLLRVNVLNMRIRLGDFRSEQYPLLLDEIVAVFDEIDGSSLEEDKKILLTLYNCENLSTAFTILNFYQITQFKVKEALQVPIDKQELVRWVAEMVRLNMIVDKNISRTIQFSEKNNQIILYAKSLFLRASVIRSFMLSIVMGKVEIPNMHDESKQTLTKGIECANASFVLHDKNGLHYDAYQSLQLQYDIQRLLDLLVNNNPEADNSELLRKIAEYKQRFDIHEDMHSQVDSALKATGERKRRTILATASENELERYADTISEAKGFGPSQRANLISDMRS